VGRRGPARRGRPGWKLPKWELRETWRGKLHHSRNCPQKILVKYITAAIELNGKDIQRPKKKLPRLRRQGLFPEAFANALANRQNANAVFDKFSPSHNKEYIEWIVEAKREEKKDRYRFGVDIRGQVTSLEFRKAKYIQA
jgi:hypothetical protein